MSLVKWKRNNGSFPNVSSMVDNFFKDDFMPRWGEFPVFRREMTVPAVNISETETAFSVEVAAPGMKKNDFNIEVENGLLVISA
ncbi:MAG: Hsp20 family protein, partial [Bacteroidota bacterium]